MVETWAQRSDDLIDRLQDAHLPDWRRTYRRNDVAVNHEEHESGPIAGNGGAGAHQERPRQARLDDYGKTGAEAAARPLAGGYPRRSYSKRTDDLWPPDGGRWLLTDAFG